MVYHVLNGDSLTERFLATGIQGEVVVARECLIEGDLNGDSISEFWLTRANYLSNMSQLMDQADIANVIVSSQNLSKVHMLAHIKEIRWRRNYWLGKMKGL